MWTSYVPYPEMFRWLRLGQVTSFLQDYPNAVQRAETLDAALEKNASAISSNYADLVALTARQAMGATELTVGVASDGTFNLSDVKMFMKDLGGPGATGQYVVHNLP